MSSIADVPVLSVLRSEEKYLLTYPQALRLQNEFRSLLTPDTFGPNGYRVRSLYFDSFKNIDYHEKLSGLYHRKKVRLRIYDEAQQTAKLELKEKHGDAQHKTSVTVSREDALELCGGNYGVLLDYESSNALRLYTIMTLGLYRPAAVIEYDRMAFTYDMFSTRITFDSKVRTSEYNLQLYNTEMPWDYVMDQQVVLEVKYNRVLPNVISKVLDHENLNRVSVSKYAMGRRALNEWLD